MDDDQKERRVEVCQDILEHLQTEPDLLQSHHWWWILDLRVWPGDQAPEPSVEVSVVAEAKESETVEVQNQAHADRVLRCERNRHMEFLPQGQTVNQHVYKEILWRLFRSVREKRRELWQDNAWLLHQDNVPAHNAIHQFLAERNVTMLDHPPYSPDLAPCDFFLFPKLKEVIKGVRFPDMEAIKKAVMTELKYIPEESFQECWSEINK